MHLRYTIDNYYKKGIFYVIYNSNYGSIVYHIYIYMFNYTLSMLINHIPKDYIRNGH